MSMVRNQALDGVRGLAALGVLYSHVIVHMGLLPFAPLGGMGVLMFFVLSGYLIASICWKAAPDAAAYRAFPRSAPSPPCARQPRTRPRGGPLLLLLGGLTARQVVEGGLFALTQTTGFALKAGYDLHAAFRPTWSLTVEWLFYLGFPVVLMALRRRGARPHSTLKPLVGLSLVLYVTALPLSFTDFYLLPVANLGSDVCWSCPRVMAPKRSCPGALDRSCSFILRAGAAHHFRIHARLHPQLGIQDLGVPRRRSRDLGSHPRVLGGKPHRPHDVLAVAASRRPARLQPLSVAHAGALARLVQPAGHQPIPSGPGGTRVPCAGRWS